jgi:hypothetical protein
VTASVIAEPKPEEEEDLEAMAANEDESEDSEIRPEGRTLRGRARFALVTVATVVTFQPLGTVPLSLSPGLHSERPACSRSIARLCFRWRYRRIAQPEFFDTERKQRVHGHFSVNHRISSHGRRFIGAGQYPDPIDVRS